MRTAPAVRASHPRYAALHSSRACRLLLAIVCAWGYASTAAAQGNQNSAAPAGRPSQPLPHGAELTGSHPVPLLAAPPSLADFEGMETADPSRFAYIDGFTQREPNNGAKASERTEVYLARTRTALYAVFLCHEPPELIRRHMARRENILTDETVSLLLDPFADRRRGVLFQVNPLGVQADAAWTDVSDPDYSYDQIWQSSARIVPGGWMAMIAVPFQSLRFPPGPQGWGVVLMRTLPRASETDTWPTINANVAGTLSQEGTLAGIEGVTGAHNVQLNPYVLGQNVHTLNTQNPETPYFSRRSLAGTAGGEVKAVVKDSIVLDATINPDFSQVESDQPQFTVNARYPVFYPELRPFFLENASYFDTPIALLYTRNIVHPEFGARVTGKIGHTNLGLLAIDDRQPGEGAQPGDPLYRQRAHYAVARVNQDLGRNSSAGLMYADQELAGSWNRVGGFDFNARLGQQWRVLGQAVASSTRHLDGSYAAGPAFKLATVREGRSFSLDDTFRDYSQGFESDTGFITTTAFRQNQDHVEYVWYPLGRRVQRFGLEESSKIAFDRSGQRIYRYLSGDPYWRLRGNVIVAPLFGQNSDTVGPAAYPLLKQPRNLTENFVGFVFKGAPLPQLSFNLTTTYGGNVNYNPAAGQIPSLMNQNYVQALVTLQPFGGLTIDNTYLLDRNFSREARAFAFESQKLRTKINYQFTRAFSARVIVEYDSLLANPAVTSLTRTKQLSTQVLFTWLPSPGTAIYAGYNNDLQNLNRGLCQRTPLGTCDLTQPPLPRANDYLNDGRQFFIKASYLLRF